MIRITRVAYTVYSQIMIWFIVNKLSRDVVLILVLVGTYFRYWADQGSDGVWRQRHPAERPGANPAADERRADDAPYRHAWRYVRGCTCASAYSHCCCQRPLTFWPLHMYIIQCGDRESSLLYTRRVVWFLDPTAKMNQPLPIFVQQAAAAKCIGWACYGVVAKLINTSNMLFRINYCSRPKILTYFSTRGTAACWRENLTASPSRSFSCASFTTWCTPWATPTTPTASVRRPSRSA